MDVKNLLGEQNDQKIYDFLKFILSRSKYKKQKLIELEDVTVGKYGLFTQTHEIINEFCTKVDTITEQVDKDYYLETTKERIILLMQFHKAII
jgi:hypothetical protein